MKQAETTVNLTVAVNCGCRLANGVWTLCGVHQAPPLPDPSRTAALEALYREVVSYVSARTLCLDDDMQEGYEKLVKAAARVERGGKAE